MDAGDFSLKAGPLEHCGFSPQGQTLGALQYGYWRLLTRSQEPELQYRYWRLLTSECLHQGFNAKWLELRKCKSLSLI